MARNRTPFKKESLVVGFGGMKQSFFEWQAQLAPNGNTKLSKNVTDYNFFLQTL